MKANGFRRVRLEDVAREAGVAKSTASRVLNGSTDIIVRDDTRQRVVDAARRLAYRPHAAAQGLKRARTGTVGLVVPSLATVSYTRIIRGAVSRGVEVDVSVLLAEDAGDGAEAVLGALLRSGRIDGVLVASARPGHALVQALEASGIPRVFVNRAVPGSRRNVVLRDDDASRLAVEHLSALGHRHLGMVAGPLDIDPARRRADAFCDAARALELPPPTVIAREFSEEGGHSAIDELLARHPEVTGVCTSALGHTVGVLHGLHRAGHQVPEEVSVIGYDDMPLAAHLTPPATTVRMPFEELGARAVDELLRQLVGGEPADVVIETRPEIVQRESTGPVRRDGR